MSEKANISYRGTESTKYRKCTKMPNKRLKTEVGPSHHPLHDLLDLDPANETDRQRLDCNGIIQVVQKDPNSVANAKYLFKAFENRSKEPCRPLHMAVMLGAPTTVLDVLYDASPNTIKESCPVFCEGDTILHLACRYKTSKDVVLWISKKCETNCAMQKNNTQSAPLHLACGCAASLDVVSILLELSLDIVNEKDQCGFTPLFYACTYSASVEIVEVLLKKGPEAIKQKNNRGETALHTSCRSRAKIEVLSLLVQTWPDAIREKRYDGNTPLHFLGMYRMPLEVATMFLEKCQMAAHEKNDDGKTALHLACENNEFLSCCDLVKLLLETRPDSAKEKDAAGRTPLDYRNLSEEVTTSLRGISCLLKSKKEDDTAVKNIMKEFIQMKWWGGVAIVLDVRPSSFPNLQDNVIPALLCMIGRRCKMLTMWSVISNKQELLTPT